MPATSALTAVQRQAATSASTRPGMREQQGVFGGVPTVTPNKPPNKSTHAPRFTEQEVELTEVKKMRLRERRKASEATVLDAIISQKI